jgi:hypothetical protein
MIANLLSMWHDIDSEKRAPAAPCLRPRTTGDMNSCWMEMVHKRGELFGWERGGKMGGRLCDYAQFTSLITCGPRGDPLENVREWKKADEKSNNTHPPNPVSEYETHGDAAVLEQPRFLRDAAEELSHELFTNNSLGYVSDKVQLGVYYMDARVFVFSDSRYGWTYALPMGRYRHRGPRFLTNMSTSPS